MTWTDGVGRHGAFVLDSEAADVVRYQWSYDSGAQHETATVAGAPRTVDFLPETSGPHYLSVRAVDASGTASPSTTHHFGVLEGQGRRGGWSMDAAAGPAAGVGADAVATLGPGATAGAAGHVGAALSFAGGAASGYAATAGALLDTSRSFTVSAWVRPAGSSAAERVAVSQNGRTSSAFTLGIGADGHWRFDVQADAAEQDSTRVVAASDLPAATDRWTHLSGTYDRQAGTLRLDVDGVAAGTTSVPGPLPDGHGGVQLGRAVYGGQPSAGWDGSVDEAVLWDRALSPGEIAGVAAGDLPATGTPAKAVWHLDEAAGTDTVAGAPEADGLTAAGGVQPGVPGLGVSGAAARFDGATGRAQTSRPPVDTAASFSVSAWVKAPAPAPGDTGLHTVASQSGEHGDAFALSYSASTRRWVFGHSSADTPGAAVVQAAQGDCTPDSTLDGVPCFTGADDTWTHLLGVRDAVTGKLRLFVNGYPVAETDGDALPGWTAAGPLVVGATGHDGAYGDFFDGDIDDVQVYDRVVTGPEAVKLAALPSHAIGRWRLDTAAGSPAGSPDEAPAHSPAVLGGAAVVNPDGNVLNESGALHLDGTDGFARSTGTPLHTDGSFTVAAWANVSPDTDHDMTVLSAVGATTGAVTLRWHHLGDDPDTGQHLGEWQAVVAASDAPGAATTVVSHGANPVWDNWSHLVLVYDASARRLSLYVGGYLDARCADEACLRKKSQAQSVRPFDATGGLQFGRTKTADGWGEHLAGDIDDVWVFQGVLGDSQINVLSSPFGTEDITNWL
ncbi:LamG-like jellyroll fold domain-containing protein [Kitasatospora sp. NBC_01539]|uniref:LamG domain-containing protein n=1 Tax=Kitasatospora sp. NBC_01539 TaxID=2903577 RepID=UPI0038601965